MGMFSPALRRHRAHQKSHQLSLENKTREMGLELAPGLSQCSKLTEWIRAYAASVMSQKEVWTPTVFQWMSLLAATVQASPPGFDSRASYRADLQSPTSTELHGTAVVGPQAVLSVKYGGPGHCPHDYLYSRCSHRSQQGFRNAN